jgi:hypothetical protein
MTIQCYTTDHFLEVICGLVVRGMGFKADADSLIITMTGSY